MKDLKALKKRIQGYDSLSAEEQESIFDETDRLDVEWEELSDGERAEAIRFYGLGQKPIKKEAVQKRKSNSEKPLSEVVF